MDFIRRLLEIILHFLGKILTLHFQSFALDQREEQVYGVVQRFACRVLEQLLESYDDHLMRQRDSKRWRYVHTRSRTLLTSFGEIHVLRRYDRGNEKGQKVFLLDQAFGLAPRQRVSVRLRERTMALATEVSYRQAAGIIQTGALGVSAMTVWKELQRMGEQERQRAEKE